MKWNLALLCIMTTYFVNAGENARFASVFSDNLVLQQQATVNLWGYASPNEKLLLKCSWQDSVKPLETASDGTWIIPVQTPIAGFTPQTVSLTDSKGYTVILSNILIGEVWLCSGQSNMEMILKSQPEWNQIVEHSEEEIAQANNPYIRFVNIQRKESFVPVNEAASYGWKICTPNDAKWLSAVAYFFGKRLFKKLDVPVGLIVSAYGGSPVQAWIPEDVANAGALYEKERTKRDAEICASTQTDAEYVKAMSDWVSDAERKGSSKSYGKAVNLILPVNLEKSAVGNHFGEVSFTKALEITRAETGRDLHINLGTMDDFGRVYFNGEKVWEELRNSKSYSQVQFTIPAEKVKAGTNTVEAKVLNVLWGGGLTGPAEKMYYTLGGSIEKKSLAGEWLYKKAFDLADVDPVPPEGKPFFSTISALYNGMIYPVVCYGIKGCIWYQGEENVGDAQRYPGMFTDMITSWRTAFNQDFPFYYVQIAPYGYGGKQFSKAAELREAQGCVEKVVPKTGMVVTLDLGEPKNIHPARKQEVGIRLANMALSETYQKNIPCKFPVPETVKCKGDSVVLTFANVYGGLTGKGDHHEFELSSDGKSYSPANIRISGDHITIFSKGVTKPHYVRYCWGDAGKGTIFNSEELPLSSFRAEVPDI